MVITQQSYTAEVVEVQTQTNETKQSQTSERALRRDNRLQILITLAFPTPLQSRTAEGPHSQSLRVLFSPSLLVFVVVVYFIIIIIFFAVPTICEPKLHGASK